MESIALSCPRGTSISIDVAQYGNTLKGKWSDRLPASLTNLFFFCSAEKKSVETKKKRKKERIRRVKLHDKRLKLWIQISDKIKLNGIFYHIGGIGDMEGVKVTSQNEKYNETEEKKSDRKYNIRVRILYVYVA